MMSTIQHYLRVYAVRFKFSFKIFSHSLVNFFIGVSAFLLIQAGGLLFINVLFQQVPQIEGFDLNQMIALYGFAQMTRGLDHFYSDYLWIFATKGVVRGEYDKYLTRPLSPLFQIIIECVQFDALGEIIIGVALYIYAVQQLAIDVNIAFVLKTLLFIMIGCVVYTCLKIIGAAAAFWIKRSFSVVKALYSVADFAKYPITIYPQVMQMLLTYLLAYSFTAYYPIKYLMITPMQLSDMVQMVMIISVLIIITHWIWKEGEKRYESSGA
ncbi:ABC-2 family transporter protein [Aerococcaceae bacterium NML130460]|nr:ABC-2 family transporter protein [Aerococcaceae bacterium NML171108]MCW6681053.1 ABC-2 family transporter protein [Aerococcaceae bacterium NML130460]